MPCCSARPDPNGLNAAFRGRGIRRQERRLLRRGPNARQRFVLDALAAGGDTAPGSTVGPLVAADWTVLDLGAGVGSIGLEALRRGVRRALLVEVSRDSLDAARRVARAWDVAPRAVFLEANAAALPDPIRADAVVLDRVVCCYPDDQALLRRAARASERVLVYSHPIRNWWTRAGFRLLNGLLTLIRHPYRSYLHDPEAMLRAATSDGHQATQRRCFGIWQVVVLRRAAASGEVRQR